MRRGGRIGVAGGARANALDCRWVGAPFWSEMLAEIDDSQVMPWTHPKASI